MTGNDGEDARPPSGEDARPSGGEDARPSGGDDPTAADGQPPPAEEPEAGAPPDRGPSGTAVLPPVRDEQPPRPRWAGRAAVPTPPRVEEYREPAIEPPRSIALPVLVTVVVMLLIGVLGLGVWLILINRPSTPGPTPISVTATSTAAPTSPTSVEPTRVVVPSVIGFNYEQAAALLDARGLTPERREQHEEAESGTVLGTDPPEGTEVEPGSTVFVIVSLGPEPPPTSEGPSESPSPTQ